MNIAIVVIAYKRVDALARLLDSLEKATYPSINVPLIISIDKSDTNVVVDFANKYKWQHGTKIVAAKEKNLGLRKHILSIGDLLSEYDALIVLEDDLFVSPNFYHFAAAAVDRYYDNKDVAGISLYNFPVSYHNKLPFYPLKNEYDAYFMQIAMSWGQVWMKKQWQAFKTWYLCNNEEFRKLPHLPSSICSWPKSSWLKYHSRYCIEQHKYFVYPYVSFTTNSSEAGEHQGGSSNLYQSSLQWGNKKYYTFPKDKDAIKYDGFFENENVKQHLGLDDVCVDLYLFKQNAENNRYWLTSRKTNYKIVKSYSLQYIPIELNILLDNPGNEIFLYDTQVKESFKGSPLSENAVCKTLYHSSTSLRYLQLYGLKNVFLDLYKYIKRRLVK